MKDMLFEKPVTIAGLILAMQTFLYGIGYLFGTLGFRQTVLYMEMGELMPQSIAGVIFLVMSAFMIFSLIKQKPKIVNAAFDTNAFVWLFALFIYILHGTPALGVAIAGTFALLSGYVGFSYKIFHNQLDGGNKVG